MLYLIILAIVGGIAMILIAGISNRNEDHHRHPHYNIKNDRDHTPIKPRLILTLNEQPIFLKLRKAFPDYFVLTQVSLAALLVSSGQVTRNKFTRYRADFVVLDKNFKLLAVIELDDTSHKGPEGKSSELDTMLKEAGYRVLRYSHVPDIEQIRNDVIVSVQPKRPVRPTQPRPPAKENNDLKPTNDDFFEKDY